VRVAVHDGGGGFAPAAHGAHDPLTPGGQGLVIVDALSAASGVDRSQGGCTVWCEVIVGEARAVAVGRRVTSDYLRELAGQMTR
jgi:hypothetical protein